MPTCASKRLWRPGPGHELPYEKHESLVQGARPSVDVSQSWIGLSCRGTCPQLSTPMDARGGFWEDKAASQLRLAHKLQAQPYSLAVPHKHFQSLPACTRTYQSQYELTRFKLGMRQLSSHLHPSCNPCVIATVTRGERSRSRSCSLLARQAATFAMGSKHIKLSSRPFHDRCFFIGFQRQHMRMHAEIWSAHAESRGWPWQKQRSLCVVAPLRKLQLLPRRASS